MSSAWLLPEHLADVLPAQARRIEELRRQLLDLARSYGCELVAPPLLEHLDSLLSGPGRALNLRTFKLVDQLSGRSLGVRADMTPQVARIDAHLLNRRGVTRLCYCGPVVHTRPATPLATREPLQFGVEVYGHAGLEADLEVIELALDGLERVGAPVSLLDLGDARPLQALLADVEPQVAEAIRSALSVRDAQALQLAAAPLGGDRQLALVRLLQLEGGVEVLAQARALLPSSPQLESALRDLQWLCEHLQRVRPQLALALDLTSLVSNDYYTGVCFTAYGAGQHQALVRGGRYDEVGAAFGRRRPAVGFSLDLKALVDSVPAEPLRAAIRAPWGEAPALRDAVRALRQTGETVVCVLPGHEDEGEEYACDRQLVAQGGTWVVQPL
ncbi:ATP phosphoribosyltransferase regulatory subunit [Inhella gelatinilytica]|uniref:ATP phosphoribosyltransferase regulatory subunit n=1 Tax=Inhella gelatinilytica TaxID=2795030 RepID=A0A931NEQ8_9BURK|nr:ATP phosphoribosyltransferase regulatory subunit [Inhella gelatinilytica]MBH9553475.1 ATP phosphoribosyltransferase regulatory subunit [Inhella gelatinilytica]